MHGRCAQSVATIIGSTASWPALLRPRSRGRRNPARGQYSLGSTESSLHKLTWSKKQRSRQQEGGDNGRCGPSGGRRPQMPPQCPAKTASRLVSRQSRRACHGANASIRPAHCAVFPRPEHRPGRWIRSNWASTDRDSLWACIPLVVEQWHAAPPRRPAVDARPLSRSPRRQEEKDNPAGRGIGLWAGSCNARTHGHERPEYKDRAHCSARHARIPQDIANSIRYRIVCRAERRVDRPRAVQYTDCTRAHESRRGIPVNLVRRSWLTPFHTS